MCTICHGSGWIVASCKKQGGIFGFRCSCYKANYLSKTIPEWNTHRHGINFQPDSEVIHAPLPDFKKKAAEPVEYDLEYDLEDLPF